MADGKLPETRVLVCGGRDYATHRHDFNHQRFMTAELFRVLDEVHTSVNIGCIIQGVGGNADRLAADWAQGKMIPCVYWPARWQHEGDSAGPRRNAKMLTLLPQLVVAFPGGPGTKNMCELAQRAGVLVWSYTTSAKFKMPKAPL